MRILITGASRGIGRAAAQALTPEHDVAVGYNESEAAAHTVIEEITEQGGTAVAVQADVSDSTAVERMVDTTVERLGGIDAVVNNAGIADPARLTELTDEHWQRVIETNLSGAFYVTRAAIEHLRPGGDVIFVSSIGGTAGTVDTSYAASKAGLHGLTRSLAREYGEEGVQVNAIAPGPAKTDMNDDILAYLQSVEFRGHQNVGTHLPEYACEPEAIAHTIEYLLENDYVQGEILDVNGGMQL